LSKRREAGKTSKKVLVRKMIQFSRDDAGSVDSEGAAEQSYKR